MVSFTMHTSVSSWQRVELHGRALRVIAWWRQPGYGPRPKLTSEERYTQSSWASRNIWAYVDDLEPNGIIRASA